MATAISTVELKAELIAVLDLKTDKYLFARLKAIGLTQVCGRCCGSGQYSYCTMHGTTCFGCSGVGSKMPKITRKLIEQVKEKWTAEFKAEYLDAIARTSDCRKKVEAAQTLWRTSVVYARIQAAVVAHFGTEKVFWRTESEYLEAHHAEDYKTQSALHDIQKQIDKALSGVYNGKVFDKAKRAYIPANWTELEAKIAPLLAQYAELDK